MFKSMLLFLRLARAVWFGLTRVQVSARLESHEQIETTISMKKAGFVRQATRRQHSEQHEIACDSSRIALSLSIPSGATPDFATSGVRLQWSVKFSFLVIPPLEHPKSSSNTPSTGKKSHSKRSSLIGSIVGLSEDSLLPNGTIDRTETIECSIPLKIYPGSTREHLRIPSLTLMAEHGLHAQPLDLPHSLVECSFPWTFTSIAMYCSRLHLHDMLLTFCHMIYLSRDLRATSTVPQNLAVSSYFQRHDNIGASWRRDPSAATCLTVIRTSFASGSRDQSAFESRSDGYSSWSARMSTRQVWPDLEQQ